MSRCQRLLPLSFSLSVLTRYATNTVETDIKSRYLPLACFACLMKWTEHTQKIMFVPASLKVQWVSLDGQMVIDHVSRGSRAVAPEETDRFARREH